MTTYKGNQQVTAGIYFHPKHVSFKSVEEGTRLPGAETDTYYRVPGAMLLIVGPLLGLLFAIFLPFIGFAMVAWLLASKAVDLTAEAVVATGRVIRPSWQPSMAFLTRAKPVRNKVEKGDSWAEEVKAELEEEEDEEGGSAQPLPEEQPKA